MRGRTNCGIAALETNENYSLINLSNASATRVTNIATSFL